MKTSRIGAKVAEIGEELRFVLSGRSLLIDSILPAVLFLALYAILGFAFALWGSLALSLTITAYRLAKRQPLAYALGGLSAAALAALISVLAGGPQGFFLPGLINGGLTVFICLISIIARRPLVAWTSWIVRRWPRRWYWHPQVRPAYSEVTLAWAVFFAARLALQLVLFDNPSGVPLALSNLIGSWPATIGLLIISYLYGLWRLQTLHGPSVAEFTTNTPQPWLSQRRGF